MSPLPPSWSLATRNDLCVAYRRCTRRDRMLAKVWTQAARDAGAVGCAEPEIVREHVAAACEAMAPWLMRWPGRDSYTPEQLERMQAVNLPLWAWLYGLLFWPAIQGGQHTRALQRLAEAASVPPGDGAPGNPAATNCLDCLVTVHETWRPERGQLGRPIAPYPFPRELGDSICQACRKFDAATCQPRPTLGAHDLELAALLRDMSRTGALPEAGGLLDQDAELWDRLDVMAASPWYAEISRALAPQPALAEVTCGD